MLAVMASNSINIQKLAGTWRAALETPAGELPFQLEIYQSGTVWIAAVINGEEQLTTTEIYTDSGHITIRSDIFHSEIIAEADTSFNSMSGYWEDLSRKTGYRLPFRADKDVYHRFSEFPEEPTADIGGTWKVTFTSDSGGVTMAIGLFEQEGNHLSGTFLTNTGDYRFLEGEVNGSKFALSAFDGSHAFLFTVEFDGTGCNGIFCSGIHWQEQFNMVRDHTFVLDDPDMLTGFDGSEPLTFCFPDQQGNATSLTDECFRNKVIIVQIMASWCPNCMDESAFLSSIYDSFQPEGLEIIAVGFERETAFKEVAENFDRLRKKLGIRYTMLLGGGAEKKEAGAAFPTLSRILAYPTTLILDRDHRITAVHTGFSGPATGKIYEAFREKIIRHLHRVL